MSSLFLVEDEVLIRMLLADMVQELGHSVAAEAGTIEEGLCLARTADFDLAILDMNLGSHTVEPIADAIDRRGLPVIIASGYNETGLPAGFAGRTRLEKPFSIAQLAAAITAATGRVPQRSAVEQDDCASTCGDKPTEPFQIRQAARPQHG